MLGNPRPPSRHPQMSRRMEPCVGPGGGNRATFLAYGMIQHDETLLNRLNISKLRRRYEMDQDAMGWGSVVGASDLMICMYDMYVVQSLANHGLDVNKETSRGGSEGH